MTRHSILALAPMAVGFAFSAPLSAVPSARVQAAKILAEHQVVGTHGQVRSKSAPKRKGASARPKALMPLVHVAAANRDAVQEPDPDFYVGAAQVYPWSEGALYRLYAAPEQISDIELQAGEAIVSVAAGDTARWVIGDTSSGSGPTRRIHILVKPIAPGLRTNLVIATDLRIYHIEAVSTPRTAMATISWTYPLGSMIVVGPSTGPAPSAPVAPAVAVENLNFDYRIEGDQVSWRPVRVFDDGHQTFIEFPPTLGDGEAPPLFITGTDRKAELVNYRTKGHYYVVDRLFSAAELRLGGKHQQVVRIVRDVGNHRLGRPT